jgi:hypothetical protein
MGFNVANFGTISANQQNHFVSYQIYNFQDNGAQFAEGKPEGATAILTGVDQAISVNVATQQTSYSFRLDNSSNQDVSFMLCGGGLS